MNTEKQILILGTPMIDVMAKVEDSFLDEFDLHKHKMHLVDYHQFNYLYRHIEPIEKNPGGSTANTSAQLGMLGANVYHLGKVFDDHLGRLYVDAIGSYNVTFEGMDKSNTAQTASCISLVTPDHERTFITYIDHATVINDIDFKRVQQQKPSMIFIEGYYLDNGDHAIKKVNEAIAWGHKIGAEIVMSLSDYWSVQRNKEWYLKNLRAKKIHGLIMNQYELESLFTDTECEGDEDRMLCLREWVDFAALTLGQHGSKILLREGFTVNVPPYPSHKIVDRTGAGDAFAAGFLYGVGIWGDAVAGGRLGSYMAAGVINSYGSLPALPLIHPEHSFFQDREWIEKCMNAKHDQLLVNGR